jgi:2-polyprenyl-3-methyl-5-hydroxy-6-metoxy-1,4-benzoquinol methylase
MKFLAQRRLTPEHMESAFAEYEGFRDCLADLSAVNRATFTHGPTLAWLRRATSGMASFSVLDVACGHGDFLRRTRAWARKAGKEARLTGIDLHPWGIRAAREATPAADAIDYLQGDVFAYAPDPPPDFIVSSQFLHHLTDDEAVGFLLWQEAHAAHGWLVADLARSRVAYFGFPLIGRVAGWHPLVRSDGQISISRGWRPAELARLAERAGVQAVARRHGPFRLTLSRLRDGAN